MGENDVPLSRRKTDQELPKLEADQQGGEVESRNAFNDIPTLTSAHRLCRSVVVFLWLVHDHGVHRYTISYNSW